MSLMDCRIIFLITFLIYVILPGPSNSSPVAEQLIDLSYPFDETTIYWATVKPFRFTNKIAVEKNGFFYAGNEFEAGEHGGTHLDAPYHFNKNGWKVGDIPVKYLFVEGITGCRFGRCRRALYLLKMICLFIFIGVSGLLLVPNCVNCVQELTSKYRTTLLDLSHPYDENTIYWLDAVNFRFIQQTKTTEGGFFYASNSFESGEHGGTHIDAPYHFNENGWKVGDIPVERLFANGIKIDAQKEAAENPNYGLEVKKLIEWEEKHGNITCPSVIVVDFGWAKKYNNKNEYFGSETLQENDLNFPGISYEAADWLANKEHIVGIGVDTPSVDTGANSVNPQTHIKLTAASKYMLENLALDGVSLPDKGFKLYITPMKIREGTGAPCRVIASVNNATRPRI